MEWIDILKQLVNTLSGAAFIGLSTLAGFYVKKLTDRVQRKTLIEEIKDYVQWAEQAPSFKEYTGEQKYLAVEKKIKNWGLQNNVSLTDDELMVFIESAVLNMNIESGKALKIVRPKEEDKEEDKEENKEVDKPLVIKEEEEPLVLKEKEDIEEEPKG